TVLCASSRRAPAADDAQIDQDGDDDDDQVDAFDRAIRVDREGIGEGGQRQEQESEQRPEHRLVRTAEIAAEEPDQCEYQARKDEGDDADQAGHIRSIRPAALSLPLFPPASAATAAAAAVRRTAVRRRRYRRARRP